MKTKLEIIIIIFIDIDFFKNYYISKGDNSMLKKEVKPAPKAVPAKPATKKKYKLLLQFKSTNIIICVRIFIY